MAVAEVGAWGDCETGYYMSPVSDKSLRAASKGRESISWNWKQAGIQHRHLIFKMSSGVVWRVLGTAAP